MAFKAYTDTPHSLHDADLAKVAGQQGKERELAVCFSSNLTQENCLTAVARPNVHCRQPQLGCFTSWVGHTIAPSSRA